LLLSPICICICFVIASFNLLSNSATQPQVCNKLSIQCSEQISPEVLERPLHSVSSRHLRSAADRIVRSANQHQQQATTSVPGKCLANISRLYTALSADYIRSSGFLCGRPDGLELTHYRQSFVVCLPVSVTLGAPLFARYYSTQRNRDALHNIALYITKFLIPFHSITACTSKSSQ